MTAVARLHHPHACHTRCPPRAISAILANLRHASKSALTSYDRTAVTLASRYKEDQSDLRCSPCRLLRRSSCRLQVTAGGPRFEALREIDMLISKRSNSDAASSAPRQAANIAEAPFVLPHFQVASRLCVSPSHFRTDYIAGMSHAITSCWRDLRFSSRHARRTLDSNREYSSLFQPVMVSTCQFAPYTKPYEPLRCIR
jgi:hypothetical protein